MPSGVTSDPDPRAGPREWIALAVLALPTLLIGLDMTVLHLTVPHLSADLAPSSLQLLWIVDIYGFLIAGFLLTMGTLGDRIGRRRLLLIGAGTFGIASAAAAFSTSPEMLIAARGLLGVAGATLMPSTLSLVRTMFLDSQQRTVAISILMMSLMAGGAIGPLVGGALLLHFWWGSVFLLSVPVMVLLVIAAPVLLPEYRDRRAGRLDPVSIGLSLAAILPIVYGLKQLAAGGPGPLAVVAVLAGVAVGGVFVGRQQRLADPMLDLHLFGNRTFRTSVTTQMFSLFVLAGMQYLIAQYLQLVLGLSPLRAGLWTLPATMAGVVGALLAPAAARTVGPAVTIAAALVTGAAGSGILTQVQAGSGLTVVVTGFVVTSFAVGLIGPLTTDLIISAAPAQRAGAASGAGETSSELGTALGIAVMGSIATAVYRGQITATAPPGIPPEAVTAAKDTLGGAAATVRQLPDQLGTELLDTARTAFTRGLQSGAGLGVAIMLGLAVLCAVSLRDTGRDAEREQEDTEGAGEGQATAAQ